VQVRLEDARIFSDCLGFAIAGDFAEGAVDRNDRPIGVGDQVEDRCRQLQSVFHPFAVADVEDDADDAADVARGTPVGCLVEHHVVFAAVGVA
jgi:hypothetical protein